MPSEENLVNAKPLAPISPEEAEAIATTVHHIFVEVAPEKQLAVVQELLAKFDDQGMPEGAPLRCVLQSTSDFVKAVEVMKSNDFRSAGGLLKNAETGFDRFGQTFARNTTAGMRLYCEAVIEIQQKNIGKAQELLQEVRQYLLEVGKYTNRYDFLVDMCEPETYFVAGVNAATELDYPQATVQFNKATQTVDKFADKYFEPQSPGQAYYKGLGRLYQASSTFLSVWNNFNQFQFNRILARGDLTSDVRQARELLKASKIDNEVARILTAQADALYLMLEVVGRLSAIMRNIFASTFKPNLKAQDDLRKKIQEAVDAASRSGPQGTSLVRFCEQLRNQIDNVEVLAKPNKKDFGIFSGLISCALFVVLFLCLSWSNSAYELKLDGAEILKYSLFPALIGGFGFGAIKFWRAFSRSAGTKSDT